jgi:PTS system galactitol-specific IIA component
MMPNNNANSNNPVIQSDLMLLDLKVKSNDELIRKMGQHLVDLGWVKDGFIEAILKREKEYPTGLPIGEIAAAIPHTDAAYVLRSAMVVCVLPEPVKFRNMADPDEILDVRIVFMLAMKEPAFQVTWLKKLMGLLSKPALMQKILCIHDQQALADFLNQCL